MASVEPLKLLLSLGFDPCIVNQSKETPLFIAARTNNIDAASVLIESGIDYRLKNIHGNDFSERENLLMMDSTFKVILLSITFLILRNG